MTKTADVIFMSSMRQGDQIETRKIFLQVGFRTSQKFSLIEWYNIANMLKWKSAWKSACQIKNEIEKPERLFVNAEVRSNLDF